VAALCPVPHETLTSRASRGGHSLPGPPRDARDGSRTAAAAATNAATDGTDELAEFLPDQRDEAVADGVGLDGLGRLDHHPDQRLGAGRA
jgi:hypothetical protein